MIIHANKIRSLFIFQSLTLIDEYSKRENRILVSNLVITFIIVPAGACSNYRCEIETRLGTIAIKVLSDQ